MNENGKTIAFDDEVGHVGVIRSLSGNLPNILARIIAQKKALGAVLHTGMAKGHNGNPAASLKINQVFGAPVLLYGLTSLVLKESEVDI